MDRFYVNDEEVLQAIADRTLDRLGMSPHSCIVFLSHKLESRGGNASELQALRIASFKNCKP